jgi:translocation and assembly module TamB
VAVVAVVVVWVWVVPWLIVGALESRFGARVEIAGWWLDGSSAGVRGLRVHEGTAADSPVWATAERVATDLTPVGLFLGRLTPGRVRLARPVVTLRVGRNGDLMTPIRLNAGGPAGGPTPVVVASGAHVTIRQEGRPAMDVSGVTARLGPDGDRLRLAARSSDPEWGRCEAHGVFDPAAGTGRVDLKTLVPLAATPEKAESLPFIPAGVWGHVRFRGDLDINLVADIGDFDGRRVRVRTEIGLRGTTVASPTLELTAERTAGRVVVEGALVRVENATGRALGGNVTADGLLDYSADPPRFDVRLGLDRISVADAPHAWQLDEAGLTGRLSGKVRLVARLAPAGVDLTGTTGDAVVSDGEIQGIPFKSLRLVMNAKGNDLKYETPRDLPPPSSPTGRLRVTPILPGLLVCLLDPPPPSPPAEPRVQLPKSVTTRIEMEDVDLSKLVRRFEFMLGYPFPVPVNGKLSLKADATIPLGKLRSLRDYAFHGDLTLTGASLYRVDLGHVSSRVDLADGVLELSNVQGRLVDRPDGGPDNPPAPAAVGEVPLSGPLPPGGFRGSLRAGISPPGKLTARFEGNQLPLGELAAPLLPRPTPLSGLATMTMEAAADLGAAGDPAAWSGSGTAQSREIRYGDAILDAVSVKFRLAAGRLDVQELTALLLGRPLAARGALDLRPPRAFQAALDVTGWDVARVLAWVPSAPKPSPVTGAVTARAEMTGTLQPLTLQTAGRGRLDAVKAGPVVVGDVPFEWATRGDVVAVSVADARPFGGRVSGRADVPLGPDRPVVGSAELDAIDAAKLSAALPIRGLRLAGKIGGRLTFAVPNDPAMLDATAALTSPELAFQGLPAERASLEVKAAGGTLGYELSAGSLGGAFRLSGSLPLRSESPRPVEANAEARAVGFALDRLWKAAGLGGALARLSGQGAVDANVRAVLGGPDAGLYAHGVAEVRRLKWGDAAGLGRARGVVAATPEVWRIDPLSGRVLGGDITGFVWGNGPARGQSQGGFDLKLDRAMLREVARLAALNDLAVEGAATIRLAGTFGDALRASVELTVPDARVVGLPVTELRIPAELSSIDDRGNGVLRVRRGSARVAGGQARADASFRVGDDRSFQVDVSVAGVDLETIARLGSDARRPASGKISGRVTVEGTDPAIPRCYRGKLRLDLNDASLVALPVFRELDRFLGSARGGLFEDGDLTGTIANRQLVLDTFTLEGRLAQLHVTGTVGFDGQLNLEVLVNTNQIIPQTGQALVALIPGLSGVRNRNREATLQVANFLSNRLLKLRVTGTLRNPSVASDPGIGVADTAVNFFADVLKLPLGLIK